jgi:hypothetical protein
MSTKLPPKELEFYLGIDTLLLNEWNLIGVSGIEEAKAEKVLNLKNQFGLQTLTQHSNVRLG